MKLGYKQQRTIDFLRKVGKPTYVTYRTAEDRRIVDSLERRGLIGVFRYPPGASRDAFVTLAASGDCN